MWQGLLSCKSWVTVRAAGAKKSKRGITFSGRRSIVGGGCCARRCGPLRAGAGCSPVVFCFLLLGVRVSPAAGWRCAMRIAGLRVAWVALCHADCWCACRVWCCAMGIAGVRVAWVALCHGDCWCACRVGGAVPWGLLVGVSRGWRCAMRIAGVRVAWRACRVGGVVPCGLLACVSRGRRCAIGIGDQGIVWVAPCLEDC